MSIEDIGHSGPTSHSDTGSAFAHNRKVLMLHNEAKKETYRLHKARLVVGSVESADVRLSGEGVAPIHAVIELNHDPKTESYNPAIYDLASEYGVFVNDKKVKTHELVDSDFVKFGQTLVKFKAL